MITNESEIRVALQAVLVTVLALNGCWGSALLMVCVLIPWKPLFAAGSYLAQPVVDWREQKARARNGKRIEQVEWELDAMLRPPRAPWTLPVIATATMAHNSAKRQPALTPCTRESLEALPPGRQSLQQKGGLTTGLAATLTIPLAIKDHVRTQRQGLLSDMELEIEDVELHGEMAEAEVRFRSPNVSELVIRRRFTLHQTGDRWQVATRQLASNARKVIHPTIL